MELTDRKPKSTFIGTLVGGPADGAYVMSSRPTTEQDGTTYHHAKVSVEYGNGDNQTFSVWLVQDEFLSKTIQDPPDGRIYTGTNREKIDG